MTLREFEFYNETEEMPCFNIGQGYGYKVYLDEKWEDIPEDEIIYIPEYGYENSSGTKAKRENAYTKEDFREAVRRYIKDYTETGRENDAATVEFCARDLFDSVDWQFPETLLDEGWIDDEIVTLIIDDEDNVVCDEYVLY